MLKIKKNKPWLIFAAVILVAGLVLIFSRLNKQSAEPKMMLFYSSFCPHCQIVEQYIKDNNVKAKYQFQELEISGDKNNAALLVATAKSCKFDTSQGLGVPFFFDGQNCLMGDENIINFFKK